MRFTDDYTKDDYYADLQGEAGTVCPECGEECEPVEMDWGVGVYGNMHNWRWNSPCCEADMGDATDTRRLA